MSAASLWDLPEEYWRVLRPYLPPLPCPDWCPSPEQAKAFILCQYVVEDMLLFPCHYALDVGVCSCGKDCGRDCAKHPATEHGFKDATDDLERILRYHFSKPLSNWGTAT